MVKKILFILASPFAWGMLAYFTLQMNCDGKIVGMMDIMGKEYLRCQNIFNWPAAIFGLVLLTVDLYYGWHILKWLLLKLKRGEK